MAPQARSRYNFGKAERDRDRGLHVESRPIPLLEIALIATVAFLYIRCGYIYFSISSERYRGFNCNSQSCDFIASDGENDKSVTVFVTLYELLLTKLSIIER